jgi:Holliday junction resolvase RusA-like endonuclease
MFKEISFAIHSRPMSSNEYRAGRARGTGRVTFFARKDLPVFKESVGRLALVNMNVKGYKMTFAPVSATLKFFFNTRRGDATNFHKAIFDALQGVVYKNDSQVGDNTRPLICGGFVDVRLMKFLDPVEPRVEILLSWYDENEPLTKGKNR